jgi:hypothetical protein
LIIETTWIEGRGSLEWFASRGQAAFEHSPLGGMLARADLFAHARASFDHEPTRLPRRSSDVTAQPTARARTEGSSAPHEQDFETFAVVSRVLETVQEREPVLAAAILAPLSDHGAQLGQLGGPLGERAARRLPGSMLALYPLTPSGSELIRLARLALQGGSGRRASARAGRKSAASPPSAPPSALQLVDAMLRGQDRQALHAAAELEAIALWRRAVTAWNAAWLELHDDDT